MATTPDDLDRLVAAAVERHLAKRAKPTRAAVRSMCFEQTYAGPASKRAAALRALSDAALQATEVPCPYGDTSAAQIVGEVVENGMPVLEAERDRVKRIRLEQARAWITVEDHDTDPDAQPHDADRQAELMGDAQHALAGLGFELRTHGVGRTSRIREVS